MAEEKKEDKKGDKKPASKGFSFEDAILLVLALVTIFFVMIPKLSNTNIDDNGNTTEEIQKPLNIRSIYDKVFNEQVEDGVKTPSLVDETKFRVIDILKNISYAVIIFGIFFSILFFILKKYFEFMLNNVKEKYIEELNKKIAPVAKIQESTPYLEPKNHIPDTNGISNPKWDMIQTYARSGNQAELRLAIIEADIMLFDVLKQSGFPGSTIGDILKNTNKSQLASLDYAWRAHKVRNELAHQGSNFVLGRTDAEAALEGYKKVFDELNLI
jgi:hypothetical protein